MWSNLIDVSECSIFWLVDTRWKNAPTKYRVCNILTLQMFDKLSKDAFSLKLWCKKSLQVLSSITQNTPQTQDINWTYIRRSIYILCLRSKEIRATNGYTFRSSCPELFCEKRVQACDFFKNENPEQVFSCKFCEIFKNTFFIEHLR